MAVTTTFPSETSGNIHLSKRRTTLKDMNAEQSNSSKKKQNSNGPIW